VPAIARQVGIDRTTVFRYLRTSTFPERQGRRDCGRSRLDPYKDYVLERWNDGCHDALRLFGRFNNVVILAAMTQSLAIPVAFVKPKERNRENGVQLSNYQR